MASRRGRDLYAGFHGSEPDQVEEARLPGSVFLPGSELYQIGQLVSVSYAPQVGSRHDAKILEHKITSSGVKLCIDASGQVGVFWGTGLQFTPRGWVG